MVRRTIYPALLLIGFATATPSFGNDITNVKSLAGYIQANGTETHGEDMILIGKGREQRTEHVPTTTYRSTFKLDELGCQGYTPGNIAVGELKTIRGMPKSLTLKVRQPGYYVDLDKEKVFIVGDPYGVTNKDLSTIVDRYHEKRLSGGLDNASKVEPIVAEDLKFTLAADGNYIGARGKREAGLVQSEFDRLVQCLAKQAVTKK